MDRQKQRDEKEEGQTEEALCTKIPSGMSLGEDIKGHAEE